MSATGDFERVFRALELSAVRYLVTGGVAVVLHGHLRYTTDLDLLLAPERAEWEAAVLALRTLRYRPRCRATASDLADPDARRVWGNERGTGLISFFSPVLPATEVNLLVEEPLPFEDAYARAMLVRLKTTSLHVVSIEDLLTMKRRTRRPKDREDIRELELIMQALKEK